MDETKDEPADAKSEQSSDENFTWDEWTVIDEGENSKNRKTSKSVQFDEAASSETSFSDIDDTSDAEEARECIDILSEQDLKEHPDENSEAERCNEESDGVSVITESEAEEPVSNVNEGALVVYRNETGAVAKKFEDTEIDNLRMMKTLQIFLVVCCLLGTAVLCIAIKSGIPRNSDGIDLAANTRCNSLFEPVDKSADGNRIAGEVESVKRKPVFVEEKLSNRTLNEARQLPDVQDHLSAIDRSIDDPDNALFERLQIFLRTMCSLMGDIWYAARTTRLSGCETRLPELIDLRRLLKSVVGELDDSERPTHERFLRNVDSQIESASDELVADFARALDKLATKNNRKVDKIGVKLAERLCVLRNTLPSDSRHRETLERSNTFVEKCGNVAMGKFNARRRKGKPESPVHPKREKKRPKGRETDRNADLTVEPRGYSSEGQNDTGTTDKSLANGDNPWETRECNSKSLPNVATLLPPPTSSCGLKRKSSSTAKQQRDMEETRTDGEYSGKRRSKGDRGALKVSKTKAPKDFERRNNRKPSTPSSSVDNDVPGIERTTENNGEKASSPTVLLGPQNINADIKYKRVYPTGPTGTRVNKRFERGNHEFVLLDRNDDKETMRKNGHWQFDRSQIRDKLRKHKSRSNWYFDRVGNWQFVRYGISREKTNPEAIGTSIEPAIARAHGVNYNDGNEDAQWVDEESVVERALLQQILIMYLPDEE